MSPSPAPDYINSTAFWNLLSEQRCQQVIGKIQRHLGGLDAAGIQAGPLSEEDGGVS